MANSSYEWQIDVTFTSLKQTFLGWEEERGAGNFSFLLPEGTSTPLVLGNQITVSTQDLSPYQKIVRHLICLDKCSINFNNSGELLTSCALYPSSTIPIMHAIKLHVKLFSPTSRTKKNEFWLRRVRKKWEEILDIEKESRLM